MAILEKEVWVGLHPTTTNYYEKLGYEIPRYVDKQKRIKVKKGTKILVKVSDLKDESNEKITKICDMCGKQMSNQEYGQIIKLRKLGDGLDRCFKCARIKSGITQENNVNYEKSLEFCARRDGKDYLLDEFSDKNIKKPTEISYKSQKEYWWNCPNCKSEYDMNMYLRTSEGTNCPYCAGRRVNQTNSLWAIRPDIAKFLTDSEIGHKVTSGSGKRVEFTCPDCGNIDKKIVANTVKQGHSCSKCSDGLSYPEKFTINLLEQLGIDFKIQKVFDWSQGIYHLNPNFKKLSGMKKYDFYIPSMNMIIETHGLQHYTLSFENIGGRTQDEERENDDLKKLLAFNNGIIHYITIDCRKSELEWIKNSILKSKLNKLYDLEKIDWLKCHAFACNSLVKYTCEIWNNITDNIKKVMRITKLCRGTVIKYLKQGAKLGWCNYDPKEESIKSNRKPNKNTKKVVQLTLNNDYIKTWNSLIAIEKELGLSHSSISSVCSGSRMQKSAGGFKWMYLDEYEENKQNLNPYVRKTRAKRIVKLDLNDNFIEEYESITKAAESLGIDTGHIVRVCKGKRSKTHGFKWMYKEDFEKQLNKTI